MKKLILITTALLIFVMVSFSWAGRIGIATPETLNTPTEAASIEFTDIGLNFDTPKRTVKFRYLDAGGSPIKTLPNDLPPNTIYTNWKQDWLIWTCKDMDVTRYDNTACTDFEDPDACCSGAGTGSCNETAGNCWQYVQETDCGPTYCDDKNLTELLKSRLKTEFLLDVLPTPGNTGDYE